MKRRSIALAFALLVGSGAPAGAAATAPMTPMAPGFHQLLKCNGGYVTVDVAVADPHVAPRAVVVTTAVAVGPSLTKTRSLREVDGQGDIYALGYVIAAGVVKRFPRQLLLPASPAAGERSKYFSQNGIAIEKRFEGMKMTADAQARPASGYVFSDYLSGRKLNTVVYAPSIGLTEVRFFTMLPNNADLVCRASA
jgi:hypothetical protein